MSLEWDVVVLVIVDERFRLDVFPLGEKAEYLQHLASLLIGEGPYLDPLRSGPRSDVAQQAALLHCFSPRLALVRDGVRCGGLLTGDLWEVGRSQRDRRGRR